MRFVELHNGKISYWVDREKVVWVQAHGKGARVCFTGGEPARFLTVWNHESKG